MQAQVGRRGERRYRRKQHLQLLSHIAAAKATHTFNELRVQRPRFVVGVAALKLLVKPAILHQTHPGQETQ